MRESLDKIGSKKCGGGEDYEFGLEFSVAGEDADAAFCFRDAMDHLIGADIFTNAFEEAPSDPPVAFGPGERSFFFGFPRREIVDAGPRGSVLGERAIVVAADVVHVPVDEARVAALLPKPIGERETIQILIFGGAAEFERDCEFAAGAKFGEEIFKMLKLVAVFLREADGGLEAILPATVEEEAFLRGKAEITLVPLAVFQDAEVFEEFAHIDGFGAGDRNVVGGPGVGGDFVFAPTGVAAGLRIHLEQDEIGEATFAEAPGCAESCDSAANDDYGKFLGALRRGKSGAIAKEVAHLEGIVDERSGDGTIGFERESYQGGAACAKKLAAANLQ